MSDYLCDSILELGSTGRWGPDPITFALQSPLQEIVPEDISSVRVQFTYLTLSDRTCYFTMIFSMSRNQRLETLVGMVPSPSSLFSSLSDTVGM